MSNRNYYRDDDNNAIVRTDNGTYYTGSLTPVDSNSEFYIEFYSDEKGEIAVTPTGGTIRVYGSPMGSVYLSDSKTTLINAADVVVPDGLYIPPILDGMIIKSKMTLSSITGANYFRAILYTH